MQKLLILDFGSPSTQALARKVREMGVFSEIHSYSISESAIKEMNPQAIILSGAANAAKPCDYIWQSGLPILELDYDLQAQSDLQVLQKFLFDTSGFCADWGADAFIQDAIQKIKKQVGDKRVILGLSGGVDSSVAAALLYKAIGQQLIPIFVDTGLMRYREATRVKEMFQVYPELQISFVDASELFLSRLAGIQDPEAKRKIIGATFIEVFEKEAAKYPDVAFLAQGTVYPDVIESVSIDGSKVKVKSHHNVGGLPEKMQLSLVEPLRMLFKDEVRKVGRKLLLPEALITRHPFPGPGLEERI
ncbi:MAG: glutamine-hydrolyzing GMP synthase, partial [Candidatus Cloacimonetes bacterium]|nr:glutamine-hydrolyzing GMP synthase [Candidatus Cloacimonadota bacterium]